MPQQLTVTFIFPTKLEPGNDGHLFQALKAELRGKGYDSWEEDGEYFFTNKKIEPLREKRD